MSGVLDCIVEVSMYNFAVYPFELCFELSYVNTSHATGSNTALEFLFFFPLHLCLHHSIIYFNFGHSSYWINFIW